MSRNEIKGNLARLLATENLIIEHRNVETASFHVDKRMLVLPNWSCSNTVYDLLVGHEVGHALFTPNTNFSGVGCPKSFINVTEDARIEKLMKRKFPGLARDFYNGYQELNTQDFFSTQDKDASEFKLIDRINLHFKIGAYALMPFDVAERPLVDAVSAAETFEEAVAAAVAIYEFMKQQEQSKKENNSSKTDGSGSADGETEGTPQQPKDDPADLDTPSYETDSMTHEEMLEEAERREEENEEEGSRGSNAPEQTTTDMSQVDTMNSFEERLKDHVEYSHNNYFTLPTVSLDSVVVDNKVVWERINHVWQEMENAETSDWEYYNSKYRDDYQHLKKEVNYLVKEFEMKKSASQYARAMVSKTGVLDTSKLHTYKYSDDIFKKISITPDGKNHGLIFYLDWSGSMAHVLHDTYRQLLSLCMFCRKVGIPFEVYSFVQDSAWMNPDLPEVDERWKIEPTEGEMSVSKAFFLVNLLSSRVNNKEFDDQAKKLHAVTASFSCRYDIHHYYHHLNVPYNLGLGGTPLNEAVANLPKLIKSFQSRTDVEKVNVIILTDGEANGSVAFRGSDRYEDYLFPSLIQNGHILRNRSNGKTYNVKSQFDTTETLLRYTSDMFPEVNILGFRIATNRDANAFIRYYIDESQKESVMRDWKKTKSFKCISRGYNELYVMSATTMGASTDFEVEDDASKAQIRTAFKKSLTGKAVNRKILSAFVSQIA